MHVPPKSAPRIFLIDAYALIYRSYFAFIKRPLTNSRGENTSAPFGFTNFLLELRERFEPDYLAVVFDAGDSFRDEIYPEYKATREKMPDDLRASLERIRRIVEGFRFRVVELDGYEADDVIGTLAARAREAGLDVAIVSGDKDFYQLVGPGVHLLNPGRGGPTGVAAEWVTEENAHEKFGVPPERVADYLALVGDASDNVPGAPGIGPKTAVKLIEEHPDLEELLAHAGDVRPARAAASLREHADDVRLSRRLVTILTDLDVPLDLEACRVGEPDAEALRGVFVELEFRRLAERFTAAAEGDRAAEGAGGEGARDGAPVRHSVTSVEEAVRLASRLREAGLFALAVQGSDEAPLRGEVVGLALALTPGEAWYLPLRHRPPGELALDGDESGAAAPPGGGNLPPLGSAEMAPLRSVLEDAGIAKVGHDLKRAALELSTAGVELRGHAVDVMVASYLLDPGRRAHDLGYLALDLLARKTTDPKELTGSGRSWIPVAEVALERVRGYLCERVELTLDLAARFEPELDEAGLARLMRDVEMPLVRVLAGMERAGITIDQRFFGELGGKLRREIELVREDIFKVAGTEFNVNSTPQLREILFERLGLPVVKRTKTGPSTDASVLEELAADGHEVPRLLLEYRELEKLRGTYVDALPRLVNPRTGRIHTSFNQAVAATGRLSSSDPNLQNIPTRTPLGRELRKGFVATAGTRFLSVDYSQIELRILAHFSGDDAFVTAFRTGVDVHVQTASVIFDVPVSGVTPEMRARAKTVNFATLYGQGPFSLARQLGITREEARAFIDTYFERFSGVRAYLDAQVEKARESGYVETLLGRRRYVPELRSRNWNVRQFGERVAQNTPIQGTAADMIKVAMVRIARGLEEAGSGARVLLQVHDELLLEVPDGELEAVRDLVVERMESAVELDVPVVAEWGTGGSWYECK